MSPRPLRIVLVLSCLLGAMGILVSGCERHRFKEQKPAAMEIPNFSVTVAPAFESPREAAKALVSLDLIREEALNRLMASASRHLDGRLHVPAASGPMLVLAGLETPMRVRQAWPVRSWGETELRVAEADGTAEPMAPEASGRSGAAPEGCAAFSMEEAVRGDTWWGWSERTGLSYSDLSRLALSGRSRASIMEGTLAVGEQVLLPVPGTGRVDRECIQAARSGDAESSKHEMIREVQEQDRNRMDTEVDHGDPMPRGEPKNVVEEPVAPSPTEMPIEMPMEEEPVPMEDRMMEGEAPMEDAMQEPMMEGEAPMEDAMQEPMMEGEAPMEDAMQESMMEGEAPMEDAMQEPMMEGEAPMEDAMQEPMMEGEAPMEDAMQEPMMEGDAPMEDAMQEPMMENPAPMEDASQMPVEDGSSMDDMMEEPAGDGS